MPPKASDARKTICDAIAKGEEIEKTPEFWDKDKFQENIRYEAVTKRGTILNGTEEGKKAVEDALEKLLVPFAEIASWRSLQDIPQGRTLASKFKIQLRDVMAQALASSGPLNGGYGLQAPPESEEPATPKGQVEDDGLLTPGSTPQSAIDVDDQTDAVNRALTLQRGSLYEAKLRMAATNYQMAHDNDAMKPVLLVIYKLLWTFKRSAQQSNLWNVFRHAISGKMPFDDADILPTDVYVGSLVKSLCPFPGVSAGFLSGMDNSATTGWLFSFTIELLFKWDRPGPRSGQPYYLPASCTRLLESGLQQALRQTNHSLEQLYQDLRAGKSVDAGRWTDIVDWHAWRIPADATRVFFFCNPGAAANHWIDVAGDIIPMDNGARSGSITVYDSIDQPIAAANALVLRKFFYVISHIPGSILYGIDWMSAPVVSGTSCRQTNGHDCGLIALDNLSDLVHGREPSQASPLTALERRLGYMERALNVVSEWSGITIDDPEDSNDDAGDDDLGDVKAKDRSRIGRTLHAVLDSVECLTLAHWQYMTVQAQPHLASDLDGQRANIERQYPRILEPGTVLDPIGFVSPMPDHAIPRAALVLNDHDINVARPSLARRAGAIAVFLRQSRYSKTSISPVTAARMVQNHIDTSYPGCVTTDFRIFNIFITKLSSNSNFLALQPDGRLSNSEVGPEILQQEAQPFINYLRDLNGEDGVVDFL